MAKKKTAGQKAAETKKTKAITLADVDRSLKRAHARLEENPPNVSVAKRAITTARKDLRKACDLPPT